jgi:cell wall assembly regulator SMI1
MIVINFSNRIEPQSHNGRFSMKFSEAGPPITRSDIDKVERQFDISFPDAYIRYLLAYNGGRVTPAVFRIVGSSRGDRGILHQLFSIAPGQIGNLASSIQRHLGRMPAEIVPIGNDPGGEMICIGVRGDSTGAIFMWDRTGEVEDGATYWGNIYRLSASLDEFFASLHEYS